MPAKFRYLETGSHDPYYNLAFEEYVLTEMPDADHLILWQNDNTVVVGLNQNTLAEIDLSYVREHSVNVVRRSTGGGAVYHDLGNLNYSFICALDDTRDAMKESLTRPVVEALRSLGIDASVSGRNDILANGRKVSGTAERVWKNRILHHGTLLFDSDPERISGALRTDPDKFRSKGISSIRSRIGTIRPLLSRDMSIAEFRRYLLTYITGGDTLPESLPESALERIRALRDGKYATWEWNFGKSPQYTFSNSVRFPGGRVEVRVDTEHGRIRDLSIFGDFMSLMPMTELLEAMKGVPFERAAVLAVMERYPTDLYFHSVTVQEVLSVIFPV